jgi:ADP-heptose:LPS heptosyltransferase
MNVRSQLIIDKYIAKPIAYLLNFLVRLVGKLLRINHKLDRDFTRIAVCKFKGMGSIIQATPMLQALRNKYPNAEIIFVSTRGNQKILEKIDLIDTIVTVDDSGFFKFIGSNIKSLFFLMRNRPQVYFDLEIYSDYSTLFTLFTFSTNRVGFYLRSSSFRMGIYTHMMFYNPRVPISHVYLQLAQLLGCDAEGTSLYTLTPTQKTPHEKPYIVINPNASDLRLERRWGKKNFTALIHFLLDKHPEFDILLIGSKGEQDYTASIASEIDDDRLINTAGTTSIDGLIDLVAGARLMISNDTGPMHIAFCTKTPVVCLFGPCSPNQYGVSENAHVIYKNVYCSPCVHDFTVPPCKGDNVCMKLIEQIEVNAKVSELLQRSETISQAKNEEFLYKEDGNVFGQVNR